MATCSCATPVPHLGTLNSVRRSQWRALTPLLYLSIKETDGMAASVVISHCASWNFVSVSPLQCVLLRFRICYMNPIHESEESEILWEFSSLEPWDQGEWISLRDTWGLPWCHHSHGQSPSQRGCSEPGAFSTACENPTEIHGGGFLMAQAGWLGRNHRSSIPKN